ncbi:MAG: DUF502 domain-containing protein [Bacteroidales bacterium]
METKAPKKNIFRKIASYFLQGFLYIAPISITVYVIYISVEFLDGLIPAAFPGLGILLIFAGITLIGFLGSFLIRSPFSYLFNKLVDQIPIVKILYSSIKDLMSAFVGQKKKFTEPVMVLMNKENKVYKLGFITEKDLSVIGLGSDMVAVYLPHSYNFSGNLFVVAAESVTPIKAPSAEIMKFIVSGGVTKV